MEQWKFSGENGEWNSGQFSGENGEWNSGEFSGENGDWLSELSAGGNIGDGRERDRGRRLHLWDCVLVDWVKGGLGKRGGRECVLTAGCVGG